MQSKQDNTQTGVKQEIANNLATALNIASNALDSEKPLSQSQSSKITSALTEYKDYCTEHNIQFNESIEQ